MQIRGLHFICIYSKWYTYISRSPDRAAVSGTVNFGTVCKCVRFFRSFTCLFSPFSNTRPIFCIEIKAENNINCLVQQIPILLPIHIQSVLFEKRKYFWKLKWCTINNLFVHTLFISSYQLQPSYMYTCRGAKIRYDSPCKFRYLPNSNYYILFFFFSLFDCC